MTDREKVIKGLECCMSEKICASQCPYKGKCDDGGYYYSRAIEDAISLLEAQEPRVMTLDEACSDIDFCWLEIKDYQAVWVSDCVIMPNGRQVLIERLGCDPVAFKPEDYGKTWRCWENKPTEDQMKTVKWAAMNDLKPCPFCGGKAVLMAPSYKWCKCTQCRAEGPLEASELEAKEGWNRRVDEANSAERMPHGCWQPSEIPHEKYVCSHCGGACWYYDYGGVVARSRFCPNCGAKMDGERRDNDGADA